MEKPWDVDLFPKKHISPVHNIFIADKSNNPASNGRKSEL